jgi:hypothetical protein
MTANKKLNKAVRARMARTGETFSTARMHVLARLECGATDEPDAPSPTEASPPPRTMLLSGWVEDLNPRLLEGTLTRFLRAPATSMAEAKPLVVVPAGWRWLVVLPHGKEDMVQGRFAAPSSKIACLYADDYLYRQGYTGPGIGPLPEGYPHLRDREDAWVPSEYDDGVLDRGAKCECGYVGVDIRNRYEPCPSCGGMGVIRPETFKGIV